jgi:hypothetical protein
VVIVSDRFGLLTDSAVGVKGFMIILAIYVIPGVIGTCLALLLASRIEARFSK